MYKSFNIKFLFFLSLILIIGIPVNNLIDLSFIIIGIFFILFSKIRNFERKKIYFILFIPILISFKYVFFQKDINEAHSTFFSEKDIKTISNFLPEEIIDKIRIDYLEKFDIDRALKSYTGQIFSSKENFNKNKFIENDFAFSTENYFFKNIYTRSVNKINFKNREELRLAQINTLNYNLAFDKEFRRNIPYYVFYEIPNSYKNSKICGKGNIYYKFNSINDDLDSKKKRI